MPGNTCGTPAARIASTAVEMLPSGRFFIPIGIDKPEASWRCTWLSTVRAPIAPQATVSAMYCGVIGSRNSHPTGRPRRSTSISSARARRRPVFTSPEPSSPGSLMSPFQPKVVGEPTGDLAEPVGVVEGGGRIVYRTRADHHQEAVVGAVQHPADSPSASEYGRGEPIVQGQLVV